VHDFCLTESLDTVKIAILAEAHGIKISQGRDGSRKSEASLVGIRSPSIEGRSERRRGRRLLDGFRVDFDGLQSSVHTDSVSGDRGEGSDRRGGGGQDHAGREFHFKKIVLLYSFFVL